MFAPVDQSQALGVIFTAVQEIALMQIGKPLLNTGWPGKSEGRK